MEGEGYLGVVVLVIGFVGVGRVLSSRGGGKEFYKRVLRRE